MQLKTYLSIGTGIAVGVIFGMGVSEKTKSQVLTKVKKKIVEALTGEKWEPKRYAPPKRTTYASYYNRKDDENQESNYSDSCDQIQKLLEFDSEDEAKDILERMKQFVNSYKVMTVCDLANMRGKHIDYTWDVYGWEREDLKHAMASFKLNRSVWHIVLPDAKMLVHQPSQFKESDIYGNA